MQVLTRMGCLACLAVITLAYPSGVVAQAEPDPAASASSPPADSRGQPQSSLLQGKRWERLGVGLRGGFNRATFIGEDSTSELADYSRKTGVPWGVSAGIGLSRWIAIQPELIWAPKGREVVIGGTLTDEFELRYLEIPVLARFQLPFWDRVTPYLLVGPTFGFLSKFEIRSEGDGSVTDRKDMNETFDLGGLLGLGAQFHVWPRHALVIEGRYNRGLYSFARDGDTDVKNEVVAVMAGYQYSFSLSSPKTRATPVSREPTHPEQRRGQDPDDETPEPPSSLALDTDGDDVVDKGDECSTKPGLRELRGCPDGDADDDGTPNSEDFCKEAGPRALRGCPDGDDKDGVATDLDSCPNISGNVDHDGCRVVKVSQGTLELGVQPVFANEQELKRRFLHQNSRGQDQATDAFKILDDIADLLTAKDELGKLRIDELSKLRIVVHGAPPPPRRAAEREKAQKQVEMHAAATKSYLEGKGVSPERVEAVGELDGELKSKTYRVELMIVSDGAEQDQ
jgi:Outer membrane protein beta-barrel domain